MGAESGQLPGYWSRRLVESVGAESGQLPGYWSRPTVVTVTTHQMGMDIDSF